MRHFDRGCGHRVTPTHKSLAPSNKSRAEGDATIRVNATADLPPFERRHSGVRETKASPRTPPIGLNGGEHLVLNLKLLQSAKLREIRAALEADGFIGLDAQAAALGLSRSTAWTILSGSHKSSGLSARTLNRMLAAPLLGERARAKILEYIVAKRAGHYGSSKLGLRRFDQRPAA